jgi:prophage regulatory protein
MLQTDTQVAKRLTISRATVWRYARLDPDFPKPLKLSAGCARWRSDEVEAWLDRRERATV